MSGHLSAQRIEHYHQGKLAPAELLRVGDHLAGCAACREQMSSTDPLRSAFGAFGAQLEAAAEHEPAHLSAEQMAAYVDNELDDVDREIAEIHIENCAECEAELLELRRFKTALIGSPARQQPPMAAPTRGNRLVDLWRPRAHWLPLPAAALIVLVFLWLVVMPLRKQMTQLNAQLDELQKSNDEFRDRISSLTVAPDDTSLLEAAPVDPLNSVEPIVVALNDGGTVVVLNKQGRLTGLNSLSGAYEQLVKKALMAQAVKISPLLTDLIGKRDVLMGSTAGREGFALKSPLGTAIESDRPTFRWSPLSGAAGYVVTVYNPNSRGVIVSERISGAEWTPPNPLERGDLYAWEVTAIRDGQELTVPIPPTPQARFRVLDRAKLDELNRARKNYRGAHVVLGILYAQAGLQDESRQEFEALVAANPDSLTAQKLLRSVKLRGDQ